MCSSALRHRLGRTARAGHGGRGVLLLSEFEKSTLRDLRGIPLQHEHVPVADAAVDEAVVQAVQRVPLHVRESALGVRRPRACSLAAAWRSFGLTSAASWPGAQSFVGFYNKFRSLFRWSEADLIRTASHFATHPLGTPSSPSCPSCLVVSRLSDPRRVRRAGLGMPDAPEMPAWLAQEAAGGSSRWSPRSSSSAPSQRPRGFQPRGRVFRQRPQGSRLYP